MVPARRAITIRDLLTHTAGMSYGTDATVSALYEAKGLGPAAGFGWYTADKDEGVCDTMDRLASLPIVAQPGDAYVYGYNTDILGCVVERASGVPLDRFIAERITTPLGMKDTRFFLPVDQRARLATVYASGDGGTIIRAPEGARGQGHYVDGPRKNFSGGAGLLSTARDYARFLEMIRNGGALDGVRILSPRTVALMTTNQVGTLRSTTGLGFGLGFETVDRYGAAGLSSVGAFGWGGAYGSNYKVDPEARLVIVFMINQIPNRTDLGNRFPTLVYQALIDNPHAGRLWKRGDGRETLTPANPSRERSRQTRVMRQLILLLVVTAAACSADTALALRRFQLNGVVVGRETSPPRIVIAHDAVPGLMPAMSMGFEIGDLSAPALADGDRIVATLVVSDTKSWLEDVKVLGRSGAPGMRTPATGSCDARCARTGLAVTRSERQANRTARLRRPSPRRHLHLYKVPAAGFLSAHGQAPGERAPAVE